MPSSAFTCQKTLDRTAILLRSGGISAYVACAILLIGTAAVEISAADTISRSNSFYGSYSANTDLIHVTSYGTSFVIPRNYFESIITSNHDESTSFAIIANYPDFLGVVANAIDKGIDISQKVIYPIQIPNLIRMVAQGSFPYSREHDPNAIVFDAENEVPDVEWQYDLLLSQKRSSNQQTVYFQRPNAGDIGFVAFCFKEKPLWPLCTSYFQLTNQTQIVYQYNAALLPNWKRVRDGTEALLRGWVVASPNR